MSQAFPAPPLAVGIPSPRVRLARLALDAALAISDIVRSDAGMHGLRVTIDPPAGLLRGVSVTAQDDGRYVVDLGLVARMVPLLPLGDEVRRRVESRAALEGLRDNVGAMNVEFADLAIREEAGATAAAVSAAAGAAHPRAAAERLASGGDAT